MPSITDIFDKYNIEYREPGQTSKVTAGWTGVDCAWCSPGWGKFRLGFETETGRVSCWVCGLKRGADALSLLCHIPIGEAISLWQGIPKLYTQIPEIGTGILELPNNIENLQAPHINYLKQRGFDPTQVSQLWSIQGIGMASELSWRLFIPIHNSIGTQVSWTTRAISPKQKLRYVSAESHQEAESMKSVLYGAHQARHTIIINEGPTDVWAIGPGAVATLGVGYSNDQMQLMAKYPSRVICFDNEPGAQKRAMKLCDALSVFPGDTTNVVLDSGADPASASSEEITELRQQFLEFF